MIPGFVIIGVDTGDGLVTIVASDTLTEATLRHEWEQPYSYSWSERAERKSTAVVATMRNYTVAKGATFREAMANLAAHWQPKERAATTSALEPGRRGLPAGDS